MEVRETETLAAEPAPEDRDLRDDVARDGRRPVWYALVVAFDAIAIVAFITWVVIPRLA